VKGKRDFEIKKKIQRANKPVGVLGFVGLRTEGEWVMVGKNNAGFPEEMTRGYDFNLASRSRNWS
jgi:hypothetical protein